MKKTDVKTEYKLNETKNLDTALDLLPKVNKGKFVGSVDLDVVLRLKENQKKESVKGSVVFPNQFGGDKKIIVLCEEKDVAKALKAGATMAGLDDVKKKLMDGFGDFDVLIATPAVMPKIVELGKVLGPKGLMPNPKNETITTDIEKTIGSFMSGKMSYKMESGQGVIRVRVGKTDMAKEQLEQNIVTMLKTIMNDTRKFNANPFKKVVLTSSMGAGIKVDTNDIIQKIK